MAVQEPVERDALVAKAAVLVEALPYIQRFRGKTVVVKYGGHNGGDAQVRQAVADDLVLMQLVGMQPVLVHGGGPEITALMRRVGKEATFVNGLRVTDAETAELAQMVLLGKVNRQLVALIQERGGRAVGLGGQDGGLFAAAPLAGPAGVDLGYVGEVDRVDPTIIRTLSGAGYVPVVAPVAVGPGQLPYNINADMAAGALAAGLSAEKLVLLTDVEGVVLDRHSRPRVVSHLDVAEGRTLLASGQVDGGMIPKLAAAVDAVAAGVSEAHIIDGRVPHALLLEVFTDQGVGTMISGEETA